MRASLLRSIPWVASGAALMALLAPGCGIGGDDLFGGTGTSSGTATSGSGASGTGASSGNGGDSSGPGPASGTPSAGPGGGHGGDPSSGPGGAPSGPASSSADASSAQSSSSGPRPVPPLHCGAQECEFGAESCCWDAQEWNPGPQGVCVTGGPLDDDCNTDFNFGQFGAETRIECQLPEHCPGEHCCGHRNVFDAIGFAYYDTTSCEPSCDDPNRILCDPNGPDVCPAGWSCGESTLLPPGYFICTGN
jgi:hypothetical protein